MTVAMCAPGEAVCDCGVLFVIADGKPAQGWEQVRFVNRSPLLCGACKDKIIASLESQVPVAAQGSA